MLKVVPVTTSMSRSASLAPTSTVIGWFTLLLSVSKISPGSSATTWCTYTGLRTLAVRTTITLSLLCTTNSLQMPFLVAKTEWEWEWMFGGWWAKNSNLPRQLRIIGSSTHIERIWLSNKSKISSSVRVDICLPLSTVMEPCSASSRKKRKESPCPLPFCWFLVWEPGAEE